MKKMLAVLLAAVGLYLGLDMSQAGATMQYVNEMPVSFGTLRCFRDDVVDGNGNRHYECNLYQAGTGAYIRNDASWWANAVFCDTLSMVWNPNGTDEVHLRNGDAANDPVDPEDGPYNPKGCGTGYRGSGSAGMTLVHDPIDAPASTCCFHGGQFLHYSVGGGLTVCTAQFWPYSCGGGWTYHYRATWG